MGTKYDSQPIYTSSTVGQIIGKCTDSFDSWPQAQLSPHLLSWKEVWIESELSGLIDTRTGRMKDKAQKLLAEAHGLHPVIRTIWGMVGGYTSQRFGKRKVFTPTT